MKMLDISEASKKSGLPASTLRFYEEKGLIVSLGRRGQRRIFGEDVLEGLALITLGRAAGFSLDEIALMFAADGKPHIDRRVLSAKADEIDETIGQLKAMSRGLRHAAECDAPSHMECPTFRRILRAVRTGLISAPERGAKLKADQSRP